MARTGARSAKPTQAGERCVLLHPVMPDEVTRLANLLDQPHLARRSLISGLHELHPVEWSDRRRTFAVRRGATLIGSVELLADDDADSWQLTITLDTPIGSGLGTCVVGATLFYAFEILAVQSVWFWTQQDNAGVLKIAGRYGFTRLNDLRLMRGEPAVVYELDGTSWQGLPPEVQAGPVVADAVVTDLQCRWVVRDGQFVLDEDE